MADGDGCGVAGAARIDFWRATSRKIEFRNSSLEAAPVFCDGRIGCPPALRPTNKEDEQVGTRRTIVRADRRVFIAADIDALSVRYFGSIHVASDICNRSSVDCWAADIKEISINPWMTVDRMVGVKRKTVAFR
jgi:hypothetical protein